MANPQSLHKIMMSEIATLVKIATVDTRARENDDYLMKEEENGAGNILTQAGGHGVFNPEMFRKLLDKAYDVIETNPNIDRVQFRFEMLHLSGGPLPNKMTLHREGYPDFKMQTQYAMDSGGASYWLRSENQKQPTGKAIDIGMSNSSM